MRKAIEVLRLTAGFGLLAAALVSLLYAVLLGFRGTGFFPGRYLTQYSFSLGLVADMATLIILGASAWAAARYLWSRARGCWGLEPVSESTERIRR